MSIIDIIKSPKEYLVQLIATKVLKKAADGGYGAAAKAAYWFLHDYAPQIAIAINVAQYALQKYSASGDCASCAGISTHLMAAVDFLGAVGLVFNVHAVEGPVDPNPGPVAASAVQQQRETR